MDTRNLLLPSLTVLLAGLMITTPIVGQEARALRGKVDEAASSKVPLGTALTFGVEGLTKDNLAKVKGSLTALTENVYVCPSCKHMEPREGRCSPCNVSLELEKKPVLSEVLPSFENSSIRLSLHAARSMSYTALVDLLAKNSIQIDAAKFPVSGVSQLALRGGTRADVETIRKGLDASGLFDTVKASYDVVSSEIHVVIHPLAKPPMHDEVSAAIDALGTKATLADVVWGPQSTPAKI